MRKLLKCAALGLVLMACCAASRPYTLDDLLNLEEYRGAVVDPTDHWLLIETYKPLSQAGRYDYLQGPGPARGRPMVVDLTRPSAAVPLLPDIEGMGYTPGPFSPDGTQVAVYRHKDDLWELGVVTLATRQARWLGVATDVPLWGSGLQWRSSSEIVALGLAPGDLPAEVRRGRQAIERLKTGWSTTAMGQKPAYTRIGSGRYAGDRDLPPPKALIRIDVGAGAVTTLISGQFRDLELSPDGRFAAVLEAAAPSQPNAKNPPRMIDFEGRRMSLAIVDLMDGSLKRPIAREVLPSLLSWSGDSRLLVFTRADEQGWRDGELQEVDGRRSTVRTLTTPSLRPEVTIPSRELGYSTVQAGWNGSKPIALARRPGADRADWYELDPDRATNLTQALQFAPTGAVAATREGLYAQSGDGVWRVRPGAATRIGQSSRLTFTARTDGGPRAPLVDLTARAAWIQTPVHGGRRVQRLGSRGAQTLAPELPDERPLLMTGNGLVSSLTNSHGVRTIAVTSERGRVPVLTLNPSLADVELPDRQPIKHKGAEGRELTSWLYTPAHLKPGERAPLVVLTYPHVDQPVPPSGRRPDASFTMFSASLLTAAGYAVLDASYQRDPTSHEPSEGFTQALLDATDVAIATGKVDPERMAVAGHSFGAYAAMVTVTRTHRFKAAIASMGPSDLTSFMLTALPHYRSVPEDGIPAATLFSWGETGQGNLGATPWSDPERYVRNSPVYQAGEVATPILLVGADQEWGPVGQMEEMFYALWRQNKDAKLLTFWGETHGLESPANIRAYWAEVFAFLSPLIGPPVTSGVDSVASRTSQDLTQASIAKRSNTSP
ncbi:MAG: S9 family peptidase [Caulobacter sp.]|nr:S9 family peptidase [Caulobacter sp.]